MRRERQYTLKTYDKDGNRNDPDKDIVEDTRRGWENTKTDQSMFDEETGIQYGQNLTQVWEPKEK